MLEVAFCRDDKEFLLWLQLSKGFDAKLGGFGGAPKFPRPVEVALMMRHYKRLEQQIKESAANRALEMALSACNAWPMVACMIMLEVDSTVTVWMSTGMVCQIAIYLSSIPSLFP